LAALFGDEFRHSPVPAGSVGRLFGDRAKYEERLAESSAKIAQFEDLIERKVPEYFKAGVDPAVLKASVAKMQEELDEARGQRTLAEEWLAEYGVSAHRP